MVPERFTISPHTFLRRLSQIARGLAPFIASPFGRPVGCEVHAARRGPRSGMDFRRGDHQLGLEVKESDSSPFHVYIPVHPLYLFGAKVQRATAAIGILLFLAYRYSFIGKRKAKLILPLLERIGFGGGRP